MCEVLIAGAGPAGSACALQLARNGVDVTIIERAEFPRTKVCGEYLNLGALREIDRLGVSSVYADAPPVHGIRIFGLGLVAELRLRAPARALSRRDLDARLLQSARDAGARLTYGRVEAIAHDASCVRVSYRDMQGGLQTARAAIAVAADGMNSTIARKLGLQIASRRRERFGIGGHFAGFASLDGFVEMYVDRGRYFAVNPLGSQRANVMLVVGARELADWRGGVDARLRETARRLSAGRRTFDGVEQTGRRVAIGPLFHRVRKLAVARTLLIGDACEFVDPFTGQGVLLALAGARRAARAITEVLRGGRPERAAFRAYESATRKEIASKRRLAYAVKLILSVPPLARRAARNLDRAPDLGPALMDGIAGAVPAGRVYSPRMLARLFA